MTESDISNRIGLGLLRQPKTVLFGPGQRFQLPASRSRARRPVLICTDERMATTTEFTELRDGSSPTTGCTVARLSAGAARSSAHRRPSNWPQSSARRESTSSSGSVAGAALTWPRWRPLVLAHGGDVRDYYGENLVREPGTPVITVPTTGGTGAEVTCISVDLRRRTGHEGGHRERVPRAPRGHHRSGTHAQLSTRPHRRDGRRRTHRISSSPSPIERRIPPAAQIAEHLYVGKNLLTDVFCRTGSDTARAALWSASSPIRRASTPAPTP